MKSLYLYILLCFLLIEQQLYGCKLWAVRIKSNLTFTEIQDDQLDDINSQLETLYHQSNYMPDGWSLLGYNETLSDSVIPFHRSSDPATIDSSYYWETVNMLLSNENGVMGIGHLRAATSGSSSIPNPHPWMFYYENKSFSLIHNGTVNKDILYDLITNNNTDLSWLEMYAPQTFNGGDWKDEGWSSVVDSELLMLYLMQQIDDEGEILLGLESAIIKILSEGVYASQMNIVFSDGIRLYAFGGYNGLFYKESSDHFSIMTTPVNDMNNWQGLEGNELIVFDSVSIVKYTNFVPAGSGDSGYAPVSQFKMWPAYPNPFNGSVRFAIEGLVSDDIRISIVSLNGSMVDEFIISGSFNEKRITTWTPKPQTTSGLYIISATSGSMTQNRKILFIK